MKIRIFFMHNTGNYTLRSFDSSKDKGKDLALSFNLGVFPEETGNRTELTGHFLTFVSSDNLFKKSDEKAIEKEEKEFIEWLHKLALDEMDSNTYKKFLNLNWVKFTVEYVPEVEPKRLKLLYYFVMFLYYDDAMDKLASLSGAMNDKLYHEIEKTNQTCVQILERKIKELNQLPQFAHPLFRIFSMAIFDIRQEVDSLGGDISHFVRGLIRYIRFAGWIKDRERSLFHVKDSYLFRRKISIGICLMIESANLVRGIVLSDRVRQDPLFERFMDLINLHAIFQNDVISLKKEISEKEMTENIIFIRQKKLSLSQALDKTVKEANETYLEIKQIERALRNAFPEDNSLAAFFFSVKYVLDSPLMFYKNYGKERYGDMNLEYCVVEYNDKKQQLSDKESLKLANSYSQFGGMMKAPQLKHPYPVDEIYTKEECKIKSKL
jgi:Terpene synthase family 2, C-terminal metal binding